MSEERFKGDYEQPDNEERRNNNESSFDKLPKKDNKENDEMKPESFASDSFSSEANLRKDLVIEEQKTLVGIMVKAPFAIITAIVGAISFVLGDNGDRSLLLMLLGAIMMVLHLTRLFDKDNEINQTTKMMYKKWLYEAKDWRNDKNIYSLTIKQCYEKR